VYSKQHIVQMAK